MSWMIWNRIERLVFCIDVMEGSRGAVGCVNDLDLESHRFRRLDDDRCVLCSRRHWKGAVKNRIGSSGWLDDRRSHGLRFSLDFCWSKLNVGGRGNDWCAWKTTKICQFWRISFLISEKSSLEHCFRTTTDSTFSFVVIWSEWGRKKVGREILARFPR